jgi:hypothetical protein
MANIVGVSYLQGDSGACVQRNSAPAGVLIRRVLNPLAPLINPRIADIAVVGITQFISGFSWKMGKATLPENRIQLGTIQF